VRKVTRMHRTNTSKLLNKMNQSNVKHCKNCHSIVEARYCPECGQKEKNFQPKFTDFILAMWDDFVSVDAKLLNTFKVLFKPGQYAYDWLAGKQQRYVHPVRLYIVLSILYSFLLFLGLEGGSSVRDFIHGFIGGSVTDHSVLTEQHQAQILQVTTLLILPISIIFAQLFHRKSLIVKNVFFVVCLYSVITICSIVSLIIYQLFLTHEVELLLTYTLVLISLIYVVLSAKKVYEISILGSLFKTVLWLLFNLVLLFFSASITTGYIEASIKNQQKIQQNNMPKEGVNIHN